MPDENGSSRLDRIELAIENLSSQLGNLGFQLENQRVNIESLHANVSELHGIAQAVLAASRQDGENIRALARIAEIHERRLTDLEGGEG